VFGAEKIRLCPNRETTMAISEKMGMFGFQVGGAAVGCAAPPD
jgi:hypothetical protein